jgi:hypothetical protein
MEDRPVSHPVLALRRDDLAARCWAGTIVAPPQDAFLAVRQGVGPDLRVAASRGDTVALLVELRQAAVRRRQMGAKERPVAASEC